MTLSAVCKDAAYRILEPCFPHGLTVRVSGEELRVPLRWARYFGSEYEPATFHFLRQHCRPGTLALDVGAHIGLFAVIMARRVGQEGRVLAFEPTPHLHQVACRLVEINHCCEQVTLMRQAVAGAEGALPFFESASATSNSNSLMAREGHAVVRTVPTVTIDSVTGEQGRRTSCIKIDVEGLELDVLTGAQETLSRDRPALSIAIHPPLFADRIGTLSRIWELLETARMSVSAGDKPLDRHKFCGQTSLLDIHAVPSEGVRP